MCGFWCAWLALCYCVQVQVKSITSDDPHVASQQLQDLFKAKTLRLGRRQRDIHERLAVLYGGFLTTGLSLLELEWAFHGLQITLSAFEQEQWHSMVSTRVL